MGVGQSSGEVPPPMRALRLQSHKDTLHEGAIPHIPGPARATGDTEVDEQPLNIRTRLLIALIRVTPQCVAGRAPPDRHQQSIGNELGGRGIAGQTSGRGPLRQL